MGVGVADVVVACPRWRPSAELALSKLATTRTTDGRSDRMVVGAIGTTRMRVPREMDKVREGLEFGVVYTR